MLTLHSLPKAPGRKGKRVGRGDASTGNYSGRGAKGQRSRSGGKKGLKLRGLKQSMMALPKNRGFSSLQRAAQVVNLDQIEKTFENGAIVDAQTLFEQKLIKFPRRVVKVLGKGTLSKKVQVTVNAASQSAQDAILKAGGSITLVKKEKKLPKKFNTTA